MSDPHREVTPVSLPCENRAPYGHITGEPENNAGKWVVPIKFETLVDPSTEMLAGKDDLQSIEGGHRFWRTQSSGVQLPESVAANLETLVVGKKPKPAAQAMASNPDWTRDELIVALNVYLNHRPKPRCFSPLRRRQQIATRRPLPEERSLP